MLAEAAAEIGLNSTTTVGFVFAIMGSASGAIAAFAVMRHRLNDAVGDIQEINKWRKEHRDKHEKQSREDRDWKEATARDLLILRERVRAGRGSRPPREDG